MHPFHLNILSLCIGSSHLQTSRTFLLCLDDPAQILNYHLSQYVKLIHQTATVLWTTLYLNPLYHPILICVEGPSFENLGIAAFTNFLQELIVKLRIDHSIFLDHLFKEKGFFLGLGFCLLFFILFVVCRPHCLQNSCTKYIYCLES